MDMPNTLLQAIRYFTDFENCRRFMMDLRWPDGKVTCPQCDSDHVVYLEKAPMPSTRARSSRSRRGRSSRIHRSGLDKWLAAVWLIVNCKNGISSYEVGRDLGVTQKSAWFMGHRIRLAVAGRLRSISSLAKSKSTRRSSAARPATCTSPSGNAASPGPAARIKTAVMGILERGGKVRTTVVHNRKKKTLHAEVPQARRGWRGALQ